MVIVTDLFGPFCLRGEDVQTQKERDRADLAETLLASLTTPEAEPAAVHQSGE